MKLLKVYIENFGKISKTEYLFNDGLTSFCYENGYGKTTIATFIKAMFYGLPKVTTTSKFNDREHYYPFNGGKFGGNLTYEHNGDVYKIVRFFDKKSETKDEYTLYKNDNPIEPIENLGKSIFGVDENSFKRTLYFDEAFNSNLQGSDVTFKLTGIVEDSEEGFENAKKHLEESQKKLKRTGNKGELNEIATEIFSVKQEIDSLKSVENSIQFKYKEQQSIKEELDKAELERKKVADLIVKKNNFNTYENYLNEAESYKVEVENLRKKYPLGLPTESEITGANQIVDNLYKLNGERLASEVEPLKLKEYESLKETFNRGVPSDSDIENIKNDINACNQPVKNTKTIKNYPLFLIGLVEAVVGIVLLFLNTVPGVMFLCVAVSFIASSFLIKGKEENNQNLEILSKIKGFLNSYNITDENLLDGVYKLKSLIDKFDSLQNEIIAKNTALENIKTQILEKEKTLFNIFSKYGIIINSNSSLKEQIRFIEKDLFELNSKQNFYLKTLEKAEKFKAENSLDNKVDITASYDEIQEKCKDLQNKLKLVEIDIRNSEDMLEALSDKNNYLETLLEKQAKLSLRYNDLTLTLNYLLNAEESLKNRYVNPVKETFVSYADKLEKVLGEKVSMDKNFMVFFEKSGENKSREYLSAGQSVLCDLCLRLALIDNMYKDAIPFIVLDDPFATLDEKHIGNALSLLKLLSKDRQIIYFTCHESRNI